MSKIYTFNKKKLVNKDGKYIQVPKYFWGGLVPPEPPEPDIYPYLLVQRDPKRIKLLIDLNNSLYYTNTPQIVIDTLSNTSLGTQAFTLSFDVSLSAITGGTVYLLTAPGLLDCKASGGTLSFKFGWDGTWYALDKKYLKSGWNMVSVFSDGLKITLNVNAYSSIVLDSSASYTARVMRGFDSNNYLYINKTTPSVLTSFDAITRTKRTYTRSNPQAILANRTRVGRGYSIIQGSKDSTYNPYLYIFGLEQTGSSVYAMDTWYWNRLVLEDGVYKLYTLSDPNNSYTRTTLPELSEWTYEWETTFDLFSGSIMDVGNCRYGTSSYWAGDMDVSSILIITNGVTHYDGLHDKNLLSLVGTMSYTEEAVGTPYPQLSVGQIYSPVSWTKVRNINATIL